MSLRQTLSSAAAIREDTVAAFEVKDVACALSDGNDWDTFVGRLLRRVEIPLQQFAKVTWSLRLTEQVNRTNK